jgi:uncharacterized protein involved in response to NO
MRTYSALPLTASRQDQAAFGLVAPGLLAALILGVVGGFAMAATLTTTYALGLVNGLWWVALAQAHGHLQLYGWAGLLALGVAFHFVPRLRGEPLALQLFIPWIFGALILGLVLRGLAQPLAALFPAALWRLALLTSGALECVGLLGAVAALGKTLFGKPGMRDRSALWGVAPLIGGAFAALGLSSLVNFADTVALAAQDVVVAPAVGDQMNVTLGLFGFLVPLALGMSARTLPMYAGLEPFPQRMLWPLAGGWYTGLALGLVGLTIPSAPNWVVGLGNALMGLALMIFIGGFIRALARRGRLPRKVAAIAPEPAARQRDYHARVGQERGAYGPFVALVASAYLWALLAGALLALNGCALLVGAAPLVAPDAIRHSLALGFIALLICGIAPRMIPGFSGGRIRSARLVWATLWLGDCAALLRVGPLLVGPALVGLGSTGSAIASALFGLSGPLGLGLAACLLINLWPALRLGANHIPNIIHQRQLR